MQFFYTDNLNLMGYLDLKGLKYSGEYRINNTKGKPEVFLGFEDPNNIGHSLEKEFLKSKEYEYRQLWSYYKGRINDIIREGISNAS